MVLVGREAINFKANAVMPDNSINPSFELHSYAQNKICVLFFYPLDFTFVCPSELIALNRRLVDFKERGAEVIGISVDSHYSHLAYKNTPVSDGGIGNVQFPLVSDLNKSIAANYGILHNESVALRGVFIIDRSLIVQHQLVNNLSIGRNVDEILRTIDAVQYHEAHGEVCPANWSKGKAGMVATPEGVAAYLMNNADFL